MVRFCATLKAIGVNLFRAAVVKMTANKRMKSDGGAQPSLLHTFNVVKERFFYSWNQLDKLFALSGCHYGYMLIMAA